MCQEKRYLLSILYKKWSSVYFFCLRFVSLLINFMSSRQKSKKEQCFLKTRWWTIKWKSNIPTCQYDSLQFTSLQWKSSNKQWFSIWYKLEFNIHCHWTHYLYIISFTQWGITHFLLQHNYNIKLDTKTIYDKKLVIYSYAALEWYSMGHIINYYVIHTVDTWYPWNA